MRRGELTPDPAAVSGQDAIVSGCYLSFGEYYKEQERITIFEIDSIDQAVQRTRRAVSLLTNLMRPSQRH